MRALPLVMASWSLAARGMSSKVAAPAAITLEAAKACACAMPAAVPRIVMGSKSSSRRALLEAMGCEAFEVRVADIDEAAIGDRSGDPSALVVAVATAKCDALLERHFEGAAAGGAVDDDVVLVTGDQVVTYEGAIREKPADLAEARAFASSYSGGACGTVGCVVVHDVLNARRYVEVHEARVDFGAFPPTLVYDILAADGDIVVQCAGGLMVEHPLLQPHVRGVVGGVDSLMGLSTPVLAKLLSDVVAHRAAQEAAHPLAHPDLGPVLGRPSVSLSGRWAVVGDVFDEAKYASKVLRRVQGVPVSPYGDHDAAKTFADVDGDVDVVNLVVSPKIGAKELEAVAKRGTKYCFLQPGADGPQVLLAARKLGLVVQQGCVLKDPFPPASAAP